jgi:ribosomal-protein-alanine N-acetyltransferase
VVQIAADEAELLTLAVRAPSRRQGVASRLLAASFEACRQRAVTSIYLEVAEGNKAARALYAGFGFRPVGRREAYYERGSDAADAAQVWKLAFEAGAAQVDPSARKT